MKQILLLTAAIFFVMPEASAQQPANVTVQDDAKVGLIVTGTGNTINTTQIFGKSPEYAELKKRLDDLATKIGKKADACEQMRRDSLPAKYCDNCRAELIALNAERDSVQKIETRFREDVIRLAETFVTILLNSKRLRLAKQFFDEGKIREADNVLNAKEIQQEGDALLVKKERELRDREKTDSLLRIKADEFMLKARLKAMDYGDSLRYDSAEIYFLYSLRYNENADNLWSFAKLLYYDNQSLRSLGYLEKCLTLSRTDSQEAVLRRSLGTAYIAIQKMVEAEKMFLRALEIQEQLAGSNPAQFESDLAMTCMNLGNFYAAVQKMAEAEKMLLHALEIQERLARSNPARFEPDLAITCMNLGSFYFVIQKIADAEKVSLYALEIQERLAKSNPAQFEPDLATTCMNLGTFYADAQKMPEAETMYLRALQIQERLAKSNPAQFEPDLARNCMNLGIFYKSAQKMPEAEKMYLRALQIQERLAKSNPAQFEPDLASTSMNLGRFYKSVQKMPEAETMYLWSLKIYERLVKNNPAQFEPFLAGNCMNLGSFYHDVQKMPEAETMCLRSLEIYERLVKDNPAQFEPLLAMTYMNLGFSYTIAQKGSEAETMYLHSLEIYERLVKSDSVQFQPRLAETCVNLGSFYLSGFQKPVDAEKLYDRALEIYERLEKTNPGQAEPDWSRFCGYLSNNYLYLHKYPEAAAAAEKALVFDPAQNWVRINLGHAHLLRGDWEKAKQVYEQFISGEKDPAEAQAILLQDWDGLEKAGAIPKERMGDVEKARVWVRE